MVPALRRVPFILLRGIDHIRIPFTHALFPHYPIISIVKSYALLHLDD